jgi:hypothetical protein
MSMYEVWCDLKEAPSFSPSQDAAFHTLAGEAEFEAKVETMKATPGARYPFRCSDVGGLEKVKAEFEGLRTSSDIIVENRRAMLLGVGTIEWLASQIAQRTSCDICGGNHDHRRGHKWENDHTDDALTYGDIRTER